MAKNLILKIEVSTTLESYVNELINSDNQEEKSWGTQDATAHFFPSRKTSDQYKLVNSNGKMPALYPQNPDQNVKYLRQE